MAHAPASAGAADPALVLYSRQGCCLCQGLQERLQELGLTVDGASPRLQLVDVDGDATLQARYGLEVPVLALQAAGTATRELPRVPPRLAGERLAAWLSRQGVELASGEGGLHKGGGAGAGSLDTPQAGHTT